MGTRSFIIIGNQDGFRGVYCHWDGYLEGNGSLLITHYTTEQQVNGLIDGGDMSVLGDCPSNCEFYLARGDSWEGIKPCEADTLDELVGIAEESGCEFVYLFKAEAMEWFFTERGAQFFGWSDGSEFSPFQPLRSALVRLANESDEVSHA